MGVRSRSVTSCPLALRTAATYRRESGGEMSLRLISPGVNEEISNIRIIGFFQTGTLCSATSH